MMCKTIVAGTVVALFDGSAMWLNDVSVRRSSPQSGVLWRHDSCMFKNKKESTKDTYTTVDIKTAGHELNIMHHTRMLISILTYIGLGNRQLKSKDNKKHYIMIIYWFFILILGFCVCTDLLFFLFVFHFNSLFLIRMILSFKR